MVPQGGKTEAHQGWLARGQGEGSPAQVVPDDEAPDRRHRGSGGARGGGTGAVEGPPSGCQANVCRERQMSHRDDIPEHLLRGMTPAPTTMSATELMGLELPPTRWAIPGVLPEGVTILGGKPKMGKSWFALGA